MEGCKDILLSGGLSQNKYLRSILRARFGDAYHVHEMSRPILAVVEGAVVIGLNISFDCLKIISILDMEIQQQKKKIEKINNKFKFFIGIDFGTDGAGLSYYDGNQVYIHDKYGSARFGSTIKPKTIILLNKKKGGVFETFGMDAKITYMGLPSSIIKDYMLFEKFKMALYNERQDADMVEYLTAVDGKTKYPTKKVFIEVYKYLHCEASKWMINKIGGKYKANEIQWIITIPTIWSDKAKTKMEEWAIEAGLVNKDVKGQCRIVYEPNCASLALQHNPDNANKLKEGEEYILVDAGGGTVDIVCHKIISNNEVKEVSDPSGGPWGSCYID
eukprot:40643_1